MGILKVKTSYPSIVDIIISIERIKVETSYLYVLSNYSHNCSYPTMLLLYNNWKTMELPFSVLSYLKKVTILLLYLQQIGTELFHNVLNPAHVSL